MKKNILAENMKRFATKNLSESNLKRIEEQQADFDKEIQNTKNDLNSKFAVLKGKHGAGGKLRKGKQMSLPSRVGGRNYFEVTDLQYVSEGEGRAMIAFIISGGVIKYRVDKKKFMSGPAYKGAVDYFLKYWPKTIAKLQKWAELKGGGGIQSKLHQQGIK